MALLTAVTNGQELTYLFTALALLKVFRFLLGHDVTATGGAKKGILTVPMFHQEFPQFCHKSLEIDCRGADFGTLETGQTVPQRLVIDIVWVR
jgi:hypothetical protein